MMLSNYFSPLVLAAGAAAKILYVGVNESGGEFGISTSANGSATGLPGAAGSFQFINESTIGTWVNENKINFFRVPFLLERMCPLGTGLGAKFNETHFQMYQKAINDITITHGAYAALDPHNYMRYGNPSTPSAGAVIGGNATGSATTAQFEEFWGELAHRFKNNSKVVFGLMNEPHDMPTDLILKNDQAAINGIRKAGARQLILAPGNSYTGGHSWTQAANGYEPSSEYLYKLRDPANNTALDIHEYLDKDFSGTWQICNQSFPVNMAPLTSWLRQHHLKAFVSEIGADNNTQCASYLKEAVGYMTNNTEYIGWSAWAAGPLWGTTPPCCGTTSNNFKAPLGSLEPGSVAGGGGPSLYETVWKATLEPLVPHTLKRKGMSSL